MIIFSEQPSKLPLPAYNNTIIKYTIDNGTPKSSTITIGGYVFDIFPDAKGEFYFNFREVAAVFINTNLFADTVEMESASKFMYQDPALSYILTAEIIIEDTAGATQTVTKVWPFIKSVNQFDRGRYQDANIMLLHPGETSVFSLSYFEGWPFDISVYADQVRTLTIKSKRTGQSTIQTFRKGVNRIFISNGENDFLGFENILPLYTGVNELEFIENGNIHFTLLLDKKPAECGQLIKWFNQAGGWSYWLLKPLYIQELKSNSRERINADFETLDNSNGNFQITGKDAEKGREYLTGLMDHEEKNVFEEMSLSPKLYYYNSEAFQRFSTSKFIEVEASGNYKSGNKANLEEFKVRIDFPKFYTQKI